MTCFSIGKSCSALRYYIVFHSFWEVIYLWKAIVTTVARRLLRVVWELISRIVTTFMLFGIFESVRSALYTVHLKYFCSRWTESKRMWAFCQCGNSFPARNRETLWLDGSSLSSGSCQACIHFSMLWSQTSLRFWSRNIGYLISINLIIKSQGSVCVCVFNVSPRD